MNRELYLEKISWKTGDIVSATLWALVQLTKYTESILDQNVVWAYIGDGVVPEIKSESGAEIRYSSHGFNISVMAPGYHPIPIAEAGRVVWSCREPRIEFDHQNLEYDLPRHRNMIYGVTRGIREGLINEFQLQVGDKSNGLVFPKVLYADTELEKVSLVGERQEFPELGGFK